jgi:hypothetical protein
VKTRLSFIGVVHLIQLFVEHENVDRQEEDQGDGDRAVEDE